MTNLFKKTLLAMALTATALAGSAPAMADGYRGYYHHDGDGAGLAIGAGIVGLAVGAIIASSAHHDDIYERPYYADRGSYGNPEVQPYWTWHDGYYWDRDGRRYEGYRREYRGYEGHGYDQRGYDRRGYSERGYDRDSDRYYGYRGY